MFDPSRTIYNRGLDYYISSFGFTAVEAPVNKVFLYSDEQYLSMGKELGIGSYTMNQLQALGITNDAISSERVPKGMKVTLYQNANFDGTSVVLISHTIKLGPLNFNDKTSSIKVEAL